MMHDFRKAERVRIELMSTSFSRSIMIPQPKTSALHLYFTIVLCHSSIHMRRIDCFGSDF